MRDDAGNFPQREGRLRLEWFTCTRLLGNARLGADKPSGLSFTGVTGHPAGTRHFCSRDVDLTGTKALHNLAIVYEQLSR